MARGKCVFLLLLSCWCFVVEATASVDAGYGLSAHEITGTSAVLHWDNPTGASDVDFKVLCAGRCDYVSYDGSPVTEKDFLTQYTSGKVDHIMLGGLKMNFNYSCVMTEATHGAHVLTKTVLFTTNRGAPEAPRPPEVKEVANNIHGKNLVSIKLFPTSTKYGPISGYRIHFNIVNKSDFGVQGNMPTTPLANLEDARKSSLPVDFKITYSGSSLPSSLDVKDPILQNALKGGTTYHVVTVAFTEEETHDSVAALYSVSGWSNSFTVPESPPPPPLSPTCFTAQNGQKSACILLGGLLPLLLILGCFGACTGYRKVQAYKRTRECYKKLQKRSQLPLGVYAPKHDRVSISHREILDRITEAGQFGTFATPQTCDPNMKNHRCLDSSGEASTFYVSPLSPKMVGTYQEDKECSNQFGMFTKEDGSVAANVPAHLVLEMEPPPPSINPMIQSKQNLPTLKQGKPPNMKSFNPVKDAELFPPTYMFSLTFGAPNTPHNISDSTPLFVQNSSEFVPVQGILQASLPSVGISESLGSELLRRYSEACSQYPDSSSDLASEDEDDLVYACIDFKTKSFVGVTKKNDSSEKHESTIRIMSRFYGLTLEDEVNIKELPANDTLLASAGNPSSTSPSVPTEYHQPFGSRSESELCTENEVEEILRDIVDRETCTADANTSETICIDDTKVPANIPKTNDAVTAAKKFRLMAMHYSKCKWPSYSSSDSEVSDDEWESSSCNLPLGPERLQMQSCNLNFLGHV